MQSPNTLPPSALQSKLLGLAPAPALTYMSTSKPPLSSPLSAKRTAFFPAGTGTEWLADRVPASSDPSKSTTSTAASPTGGRPPQEPVASAPSSPTMKPDQVATLAS